MARRINVFFGKRPLEIFSYLSEYHLNVKHFYLSMKRNQIDFQPLINAQDVEDLKEF